jgi:hypothetical protein
MLLNYAVHVIQRIMVNKNKGIFSLSSQYRTEWMDLRRGPGSAPWSSPAHRTRRRKDARGSFAETQDRANVNQFGKSENKLGAIINHLTRFDNVNNT